MHFSFPFHCEHKFYHYYSSMEYTNALQHGKLFKSYIENIGFSENLVHRFTIKKDILFNTKRL